MKNKKTYLQFICRRYKMKQGSVLAYSLIILGMMLAIATSISVATISQKKTASDTNFSMQAMQTADSGVQIALKTMITATGAINSATAFPTCAADKANVTDADGNGYELTFYNEADPNLPLACTEDVGQINFIKSVGIYRDTVRAVSVKVLGDPCKGATPSITDARDTVDSVYPTMAIGTQCWLTRNENFGTLLANGMTAPSNPFDVNNPERWCPTIPVWGNTAIVPANCLTYNSSLYTWSEAMGFPSSCNTNSTPGCGGTITAKHQGICPAGWHIPTETELNTLENFLKNPAAPSCALNRMIAGCDGAGTKIKDVLGFKFPLIGDLVYVDPPETPAFNNSYFNTVGARASFMSTTESSAIGFRTRLIKDTLETVQGVGAVKYWGFPVRCLKN